MRRFVFNLLAFISLAVVGLFGAWWFNPHHLPNNFHGYARIFDLLLFLLLTYIIWHPIIMEILSWAIASNIKDRPTQSPPTGLKVAFVTTFVPQSESIELLYKTLPAMLAADYPHDTWVLDEGNDPRVKDLCQRLGVKHYSRHGKDHYNSDDGKFAKKTKGGNHNSWYDSHGNDYDIVAQIDTDFIPRSTFLTKTLGYFRDPTVAFVGTPQIYGNTTESFIARGAAEQTYSFYGPILRGLHGMDATLLIGANHVIRVSALKDVDHYSAHITEDLLTGMKLHSKSWKSVYVHEPLAVGEGPTTWEAYFNQQMRWAYGCIDVLFRHSPALFAKMNLRRRLYYFWIQQHYFSGLAMIVSLLCLGLYFVFGFNTVQVNLLPFLVIYGVVMITLLMMNFVLQQYNVRPKEEKGLLLYGKIISVICWPIFFLAFIGVVRGKRLSYKVTPKGHEDKELVRNISFRLFRAHLLIGMYSLACIVMAFITHHEAFIMIFWAALTATLMLSSAFILIIHSVVSAMRDALKLFTRRLFSHYRFYEISTFDNGLLPTRVSDAEKYKYTKRRHVRLIFFSLLSFLAASLSVVHFLEGSNPSWPVKLLYAYFILTILYFLVSMSVNLFTKDFDIQKHKSLVKAWSPATYPTVDIFLPTAGEPLDVLRNTWEGVKELVTRYKGSAQVYSLDDAASPAVKELAHEFGFKYVVRANRPHYKKAGNLRNGFNISTGDFIVIFDADFRPRGDFLDELLPYFYENERMGIVQSPQYFDVHDKQNWLERGAGAVQELFYRYAQVSRQNLDASICVGSNAVYRRRALNDTGGTALIEHSEDVHTGFNLRMCGWTIQYVPVILAKGLCPANMTAFFKQQYRWCSGSMSLLGSKKFWQTKMKIRSRLAYFSGFMYYIQTAVSTVVVPIIPLLILTTYHNKVTLLNYIFILPSLVFTQLIFPFWHDSVYGIEAWATRSVYGWAHLFAIFDYLTKRSMQWKPTGVKITRDVRYVAFRFFQFSFNFIPGLIWVYLAAWRMYSTLSFAFLPLLLSGLYYLFIVMKVSFYVQPQQSNEFDRDLLSVSTPSDSRA